MYPQATTVFTLIILASPTLVSCDHRADVGFGSSMSCSTYNTVETKAEQYIPNTNAVSDLLFARGINAGGNHHYNAAAGDYVLNVTVASEQVTSYCASHPESTIDKGVVWSAFKTQ